MCKSHSRYLHVILGDTFKPNFDNPHKNYTEIFSITVVNQTIFDRTAGALWDKNNYRNASSTIVRKTAYSYAYGGTTREDECLIEGRHSVMDKKYSFRRRSNVACKNASSTDIASVYDFSIKYLLYVLMKMIPLWPIKNISHSRSNSRILFLIILFLIKTKYNMIVFCIFV